jgi:hypothetical protein
VGTSNFVLAPMLRVGARMEKQNMDTRERRAPQEAFPRRVWNERGESVGARVEKQGMDTKELSASEAFPRRAWEREMRKKRRRDGFGAHAPRGRLFQALCAFTKYQLLIL